MRLAARRLRLPLGLGWALAAEWARLAAGWTVPWVLVDGLPGIAFLLAGELAQRQRPQNRIGRLLMLTGFAWYAGTWAIPNVPWSHLAFAIQGWYDPLLAWLALAYPSGRLTTRASRAVVAAFLVILAARSYFRLLLVRPVSAYGDLTAPGAAERYIAGETLRYQVEVGFHYLIAGAAAAVLVLLLRRLLAESAAGRRISGPVLIAGLAVGAAVVVAFVSGFVPVRTAAERFALGDFRQVLVSVTAALVPIAFVLGLARRGLARSAVADLVVELGELPATPRLTEMLARALHDPSLEIVYAAPGGGYVTGDGRVAKLPEPTSMNRAVTRLEHDGRTVAALVHDPALLEEPELVRSVAAAASLALENERLAAEVRAQLAEVQASRSRIVEAGDTERRRVERDLHDGAQQRLVTLALAIQLARTRAGARDDVKQLLDGLALELELALGELRELARGIHPSILGEAGLGAAIEGLAERTPVPVHVAVPDGRFDASVEAAAYFVVAEALTNVAKYAGANRAAVTIRQEAQRLLVEVSDDGRGGADPAGGTGLRGLADRIAATGGEIEVLSPSGAGTIVRAWIPCA